MEVRRQVLIRCGQNVVSFWKLTETHYQLLGDLFGILDWFFREDRQLNPQERRLVSDKVKYALNTTRVYIQSSDNQEHTSALVSNIWRRTAKDLRKINNADVLHLADLLDQKSIYWTGEEIINTNISFDEIERLIGEI